MYVCMYVYDPANVCVYACMCVRACTWILNCTPCVLLVCKIYEYLSSWLLILIVRCGSCRRVGVWGCVSLGGEGGRERRGNVWDGRVGEGDDVRVREGTGR